MLLSKPFLCFYCSLFEVYMSTIPYLGFVLLPAELSVNKNIARDVGHYRAASSEPLFLGIDP